MELELTLKELEAREKLHKNLENFYIKEVYPTFQDEFKNSDIHDLENYTNYNLQNILDDLRHLQAFLDGSPGMQKFKVKKEFLLQLSHRILKKIQKDYPLKMDDGKPEEKPQKPATNVKKVTVNNDIQMPIIRKTVGPTKNKQPERKSTISLEKSDLKVDTQFQTQARTKTEEDEKSVNSIPEVEPAKEIEPEKKEEKIVEPPKPQPQEPQIVEEPVKVEETQQEAKELEPSRTYLKEPKDVIIKKVEKVTRPSSQDKKKKPKKEVKKKKSLVFNGQEILSQIAEEDVSENETITKAIEERPKKKWELTEDQEKHIKEMSAQYGIEVEALKTYLETKAANHLNWIGIKKVDQKVDLNLEISKLESEYERFMQRKSYHRNLQVMTPSDHYLSNTMPYVSRNHTVSHLDHYHRGNSNKFYASFSGPESTKDLTHKISMAGGNWETLKEHAGEHSDRSEWSPRSLRRLATTKSFTLSRGNSNNQEYLKDAFGHGPDSRNHIQDDNWSNPSYLKSKGQVRLPSISTLYSGSKRIPTQTTVNAMSLDLDEELALRRIDSGFQNEMGGERMASPPLKNKRPNVPINYRRGISGVPDYISLNRLDTKLSIEDSLAAEIAKSKEQRAILEKKFSSDMIKKGLSLQTTRSDYFRTMNSVGKGEYFDSVVMDDYNLAGNSARRERELKGRDAFTSRLDGQLSRLRKQSEEETKNGNETTKGDSEAIDIGGTIQTLSNKTMSTVYSQESPSKYISLRSIGSGLREVEGDLEYYGSVNIIKSLGLGSQAKVYLAKVKEYEEPVAYKQYNIRKSYVYGGGQSYEALKQEFHMLKQLDHDNVIKYFCLYRSRRRANFSCLEFGVIMEYMPGGSLEKYIEENFKSISFEQKKSFMKQILQGLDYLHKHNIIHRDLKPGNILLSEDKQLAKITDFGISTQVIGTKDDLNMTRSVVGTPWYMAPEIINEEPYCSKADIWSAGCCFMHLVTGQKPYYLANGQQAMRLMTSDDQNPLDTIDEEIMKSMVTHPGLKSLLEKCFSRDKDKRPGASELLKEPFFSE